ncbi:bacillithiol biosynthesis cysteine-adding enzyme BshC [Muriicola jejuensis]|uniref:Putative cysteine ligase BshC n=1 Tax=Muriicola jejuensis TaxID=504488 RepID=A0A6P0UAR4_9FLAO|nr:bacillithiol biosynthesis cysteine-adding enzyme BshC [Muriicola jejuensis]NER09009.1 bacillithiol biosynthesis cysteine-adding enzyme BshC [Muriicola jejuensis]SMP12204.1 bacillithiol biosynthesis cysteine-adding enzyme BshC [Muriicola jejuensis]
MQPEGIPFRETGYFSEIICDYLDQSSALKDFYHRYPSTVSFGAQIREKEASYPPEIRKILVDSLRLQYDHLELPAEVSSNIDMLGKGHTFTVVTGHQLNIFTGPLYFLYKIISTVKLAKELGENYPENHFVPVYWMATEDHDFEEINYFNFRGKKLQWNRDSAGPVGRLSTEGLEAVLELFSMEMGQGKYAAELRELFSSAYLGHGDLTRATRYLVNQLFGHYGLVIVDGDDKALKRCLIPFVKDDLYHQTSYKKVTATTEAMEKASPGYTIQVNPREINYFYIKEGLRERLIEKGGNYYVNNTELVFTREEIDKEIETHPERFSPNVITRPLYQEVILPNLCYIGGGGELAYWLELKSSFEAAKNPFPALMLRNSALLITQKQDQKIRKMNLSIRDLFLEQNRLINKKIREISNIDIDFTPQREHLKEQFKALYDLAEQTDKSFLGAVKAQEVKQLKGLDRLEKRLLKAQKRKLVDHVERMTALQNELFPNGSLQERSLNFSEIYLEMGKDLIPFLMNSMDPFSSEFYVLQMP